MTRDELPYSASVACRLFSRQCLTRCGAWSQLPTSLHYITSLHIGSSFSKRIFISLIEHPLAEARPASATPCFHSIPANSIASEACNRYLPLGHRAIRQRIRKCQPTNVVDASFFVFRIVFVFRLILKNRQDILCLSVKLALRHDKG